MFHVYIFPPVLHFFFCIELAVKQVQLEHVNTGSFLFFLAVEMNQGVEVKIYENKTFYFFFNSPQTHAKQNLQGVHKITSAPANVRASRRPRGALSYWLRSALSEEVNPRFELLPARSSSVLQKKTPETHLTADMHYNTETSASSRRRRWSFLNVH